MTAPVLVYLQTGEENRRFIGRLATKDRRIFFEWDPDARESGLALAKATSIRPRRATAIVDEVCSVCSGAAQTLRTHGVSRASAARAAERIDQAVSRLHK